MQSQEGAIHGKKRKPARRSGAWESRPWLRCTGLTPSATRDWTGSWRPRRAEGRVCVHGHARGRGRGCACGRWRAHARVRSSWSAEPWARRTERLPDGGRRTARVSSVTLSREPPWLRVSWFRSYSTTGWGSVSPSPLVSRAAASVSLFSPLQISSLLSGGIGAVSLKSCFSLWGLLGWGTPEGAIFLWLINLETRGPAAQPLNYVYVWPRKRADEGPPAHSALSDHRLGIVIQYRCLSSTWVALRSEFRWQSFGCLSGTFWLVDANTWSGEFVYNLKRSKQPHLPLSAMVPWLKAG